MVYCGKPSAACDSCRKRRVRCDQRQPSCTQCLNKSSQCPGYRNPIDVMFRDETSAVVKRVQNAHKRISPDGGLSLSRSISEAIHEVAMCHFLQSYAPNSHFDYLPNLTLVSSCRTSLMLSVYAVGLANLSRERQEPAIMKSARKFYSRALQGTNAALQSQDAELDSTLVSVLVLSLFETIAQEGQKLNSESWDIHTEGAVSLLLLRGLKPLQSDLGRRLYIHVSNNIRVSCAQRGVLLSKEFVELDSKASKYLDHKIPVLQFWPIVDAFIQLQVMSKDKQLSNAEDILRLALDLEQKAIDMANSLGGIWSYTVVDPEEAPPESFQGIAHKYQNHLIARLWNTIRMTLVFVNETVYEQASLMANNASPAELSFWSVVQENAARNALDAAVSILASVPQFIKKPQLQKGNSLGVTTASAFVWPLAAVGKSLLVTQEARTYATEALFSIGHQARLPQAFKIADMLKTDTLPLERLHMFHLA